MKDKTNKKSEKNYLAKMGKRARDENCSEINDRRRNVGPNLSFAGAEAYKLLRTNLMLSMSADIPCKVIGVTSALRGEGKSTTSTNLAYSLAEAGLRVMLVEADMRLPFIAKTLKIEEKPGLSNFLSGQVQFKDAVRSSVLKNTLYVLPAGDTPPNPSELLGSELMGKAIESLSQTFDYLILDLPPITAVSDGLAISNLLTGMIVVVRENYCDQRSLNDAMRQLEFLDVKLLGFVVNGSDTRSKSYGNYSARKGNYGYYRQPDAGQKKSAASPDVK